MFTFLVACIAIFICLWISAAVLSVLMVLLLKLLTLPSSRWGELAEGLMQSKYRLMPSNMAQRYFDYAFSNSNASEKEWLFSNIRMKEYVRRSLGFALAPFITLIVVLSTLVLFPITLLRPQPEVKPSCSHMPRDPYKS